MEIQSNNILMPITYNRQGLTFNKKLLSKNKPSWCREFYTAEEFNAKFSLEVKRNACKKMTIEQQEMMYKMLKHNILVNGSTMHDRLSTK